MPPIFSYVSSLKTTHSMLGMLFIFVLRCEKCIFLRIQVAPFISPSSMIIFTDDACNKPTAICSSQYKPLFSLYLFVFCTKARDLIFVVGDELPKTVR